MLNNPFCRSLVLLHLTSAWIQNPEPRMYNTYTEDQIDKFSGNDSYVDYFKLLEIDSDSILVGSRNVIYNITLSNLTENRLQRIVWPPTGAHRELCYLKGKSEEDCHNYIRVGAKVDEDKLLICGTNAYKPLCRHYKFIDGKNIVEKEMEGQGWCPYDPDHNSSAVYSDGHLYTATVADFGGVESIIYRDPLRTERSDLKQLNDANFVSSMSYQDYVLFFFREAAVEYINCGKIIYSRVGRVCKRDKGGPHQFGDRWTSFIKARLNCSIPGDYPFYFNEIQSTSKIVQGMYGANGPTKLIYGIFTTPSNSIGGSAVCAFSLDSIMNIFDGGAFKEQENMNSNWLKVPQSKMPHPRPGQCVNDSRTLPDVSVNFVKTHTLMDEAVSSYVQPLLVRVSLRNRFSAITVDPQVKTITGQPMDVLFIGTGITSPSWTMTKYDRRILPDSFKYNVQEVFRCHKNMLFGYSGLAFLNVADDGRIMKAINRGGDNPKAIFTEEIHVGSAHLAIKSLTIVRPNGEPPKLLIVTHDFIHAIPLYRCSKVLSCRECVAIQDPYCAWDMQNNLCVAHALHPGPKKNFLQNIARGSHHACQPPGNVKSAVAEHPLEKDFDVDDKVGNICPKCSSCNPLPCLGGEVGAKEKIVIYTADTLGIVVSSSVFATLIVGFVAGYFCSRRFRPDNTYTNMPLHQQHNSIGGESASYITSCVNNKSINLLVNVPPKNSNDKNANSSSENNKSLQKVKKTYI